MTLGTSGLQKAVFPLSQLPPLTIINGKLGYYVRYRIVSEDKNKLSHWSAEYPVTSNFDFRRPIIAGSNPPAEISQTLIDPIVTNVSGTRFVTFAWEPVSAYINDNFITRALGYDIWLKWYKNGQDGDWFYEERVTETSLTVIRPTSFNYTNPSTGIVTSYTGTDRLEIEIYARQIQPRRSTGPLDPINQILLYKSNVINV